MATISEDIRFATPTHLQPLERSAEENGIKINGLASILEQNTNILKKIDIQSSQLPHNEALWQQISGGMQAM